MNEQPHGPLTLENEWIQVTIDPSDGGRVINLIDRSSNTPLIWTNPRTSHVRRYYGCNYDDLSNSGLEEAFPTVQPCAFEDIQQLPFFGEVWTLPWRVCSHSACSIILSCQSPCFPAEIRKSFFFSKDGKALCTNYEIQNIGVKPFPYVFGVHPSLTLFEDSQLYAPKETYQLYVSMPQKVQGIPQMEWPIWNGLNFSQAMPSESLGCYNLVAMPVRGAHYGVYHPGRGVGLDVHYDPSFFRCLSLWPIYGGFRGHTCLMSEVFTCYPAGLDEAIRLGLAQWLEAGQVQRTSVFYQILTEMPKEADEI